MGADRQVVLRGPDEGHCLGWQGGMVIYKALSAETDGRYALSRGDVASWSGPKPCVQTREDRGFYVMAGELTFSAGNQTLKVPEGGFLNVSRGTAHAFVNSSEAPARVLVLNAPGGFDRFQLEAGHPLAGPDAIVPPASPEDLPRMAAVAAKYGIDLAPPPSAFRAAPAVRLTGPGKGRTIYVVGDLYRFLAVGDDTNGSYAFWEALVPPGGGPPLHVHSREEEGFYVLDGEATFTIGDEVVRAEEDSFVNLPPGIRHSFRNQSMGILRMLIVVAPAGLEKMFFETGVPATDPRATMPPPSDEEIERLLAAAPRYGITIFP